MKKTAYVKIDKREKDTLTRCCLESRIKVEFFIIETNENLLLAAITVDDLGQLFVLGRMVQIVIEMDAI
jgi:hypothetical protein